MKKRSRASVSAAPSPPVNVRLSLMLASGVAKNGVDVKTGQAASARARIRPGLAIAVAYYPVEQHAGGRVAAEHGTGTTAGAPVDCLHGFSILA
jgi:hypothetical protein